MHILQNYILILEYCNFMEQFIWLSSSMQTLSTQTAFKKSHLHICLICSNNIFWIYPHWKFYYKSWLSSHIKVESYFFCPEVYIYGTHNINTYHTALKGMVKIIRVLPQTHTSRNNNRNCITFLCLLYSHHVSTPLWANKNSTGLRSFQSNVSPNSTLLFKIK